MRTATHLTLRSLLGSLVVATAAGAQPTPQGSDSAYISVVPGEDRFPLATGGQPVPLYISSVEHAGVLRALGDLRADLGRVTGREPLIVVDSSRAASAVVLVGTLGVSPSIDQLASDGKLAVGGITGQWEAFVLQVVDSPLPGIERALVIAGSDRRGTMFGMYELSERIGVSPWYWWADVPVRRSSELHVQPGRRALGPPAVKYRGIFINDEAPAMSGWAQEKFGGFNHHLYEKVFELILRLKGNFLWPAMWGRSIYDDDPESPRLADEYGIVLGTSHHEPMSRAHVEWQRYGSGDWDHETNDSTLRAFWREGIRRMGSNESIVTLGMRGDGDRPMSRDADIALLERIVADQRAIIGEETGREPAETPQVWALYKEVQDYYDLGMRVPDDVTLLFADDNWGNIRKLPDPEAPPRAGGYGVYYHYDYVGGPRNYKWINTNPIARVWEQLHLAHRHGADRIWIVNVGDIKPMEFPTSFFLDYAWDPERWPAERLPDYVRQWAGRQFGAEHAAAIAHLLTEYSRYNGRRKPELLSPETYSLHHYREWARVVSDYNALLAEARRVRDALPAEYHDACYQLILHPVEASANLNELYYTVALNRLYAKQGRAATDDVAARARRLFARDAEISRFYNDTLAGGKWSHMMDQTHIGYTGWQQPPRDVMPHVEEIEIPEGAFMGVAIEGSDSWWEGGGDGVLPAFERYAEPTRIIEVFNRGSTPFEYSVTSDAPWLLVSRTGGTVDQQDTLEVSVDWARAPAGTHQGRVEIVGPGGRRVAVGAVLRNRAVPAARQPERFIEAGGYVSMEAEHYTRAVAAEVAEWRRIPDLGRTLSAMTPLPVTASAQPAGGGPRLEYHMHLFEGGEITVRVYVSPTLDYNDTKGLRYAIAFDGEAPQVVNVLDDLSDQAWARAVSDNIRRPVSRHTISGPGDHVLKVWMMDPGVVLQKIVVERGSIPPSYLGPPESYRQAAR